LPRKWKPILYLCAGDKNTNFSYPKYIICPICYPTILKTALEPATLLGVLKDALSTPAVARLAESASTLVVAGGQLIAELGGLERIRKGNHGCKRSFSGSSTRPERHRNCGAPEGAEGARGSKRYQIFAPFHEEDG